MMEDAKVGAVIVMEDNVPVGIVTDRDFSVKVAAHSYQITEPVKQIMSSPLFSINSDESVRIAADLMHERKIRKLPVIDDENIVGIITATDIVNLLSVSVEEDMRDMYFHSVAKIYTTTVHIIRDYGSTNYCSSSNTYFSWNCIHASI